MSNGSTIVIQNCQAYESNKRQDEVAWIVTSFRKTQPICALKKSKRKKNAMSIAYFSWLKALCITLLGTKPALTVKFTCLFLFMIMHSKTHMLYEHNLLYICQFPRSMFSLLSLGWMALLESQPLAFLQVWASVYQYLLACSYDSMSFVFSFLGLNVLYF